MLDILQDIVNNYVSCHKGEPYNSSYKMYYIECEGKRTFKIGIINNKFATGVTIHYESTGFTFITLAASAELEFHQWLKLIEI